MISLICGNYYSLNNVIYLNEIDTLISDYYSQPLSVLLGIVTLFFVSATELFT